MGKVAVAVVGRRTKLSLDGNSGALMIKFDYTAPGDEEQFDASTALSRFLEFR